ncbi:hypothetical protein M422DRAFT_35362, partial [Sphaerobolus stellatus SS14]
PVRHLLRHSAKLSTPPNLSASVKSLVRVRYLSAAPPSASAPTLLILNETIRRMGSRLCPSASYLPSPRQQGPTHRRTCARAAPGSSLRCYGRDAP